MEPHYIEQSRLVVEVLPLVSQEPQFALKGGTAINLFENDLPRLSVDIDLTFRPVTDRPTAIREINAALSRVCKAINKSGISARLSGSDVSRKIVCSKGGTIIKLEPNFILRGTVFPVREMSVSPRAEELLGYCKINVLSRAELYGGKFCAALDRQHPRDLFDVAQFFGHGGTVEEVKNGFLALALGHNRPLHEILAPNMLDQAETFASQFAGMSDVPFTLDEHVATFRKLVADINASLTPEERERLVAFTALEADADVFGIPGLERLPAIQWKRKNLETLRRSDARKFSGNVKSLEMAFATSPPCS
jgi:predicted nucleotidyltransferase component of viral defense system